MLSNVQLRNFNHGEGQKNEVLKQDSKTKKKRRGGSQHTLGPHSLRFRTVEVCPVAYTRTFKFSNARHTAGRVVERPREQCTRDPAKLARAETRNTYLSFPKSTGLGPLLSRCSVAVSQAVVCGLRERVCERVREGIPRIGIAAGSERKSVTLRAGCGGTTKSATTRHQVLHSTPEILLSVRTEHS